MPVKPKNPWDLARQCSVLRSPSDAEPLADLEPGVKFFVLMLEKLGLRTGYSCEGHPGGFYITFHGPYPVALMIEQIGFFTVEIEGQEYWSMRISDRVLDHPTRTRYENKRLILRTAAKAWEEKFGPLTLPATQSPQRHRIGGRVPNALKYH